MIEYTLLAIIALVNIGYALQGLRLERLMRERQRELIAQLNEIEFKLDLTRRQ